MTTVNWHQGIIAEYDKHTRLGYVKNVFTGATYSFQSNNDHRKNDRVNFEVTHSSGISRVTAIVNRKLVERE